MYYVSQTRFYLRGERGVGSLLQLLARVREIPSDELRKKASEGEKVRPNEMALLGEVISRDKILEIRQKPGYWISRCCDLTPTRIKFQITNGTVHMVVASIQESKLKVTDNGKILPIETVGGLREFILNLAGVE